VNSFILPSLGEADFNEPERIRQKLEELGIFGLIVFQTGGVPIITRSFSNNKKNTLFMENGELLSGFLYALDSYCNFLETFLTDTGLGHVRIAVKRDYPGKTICLFFSEIINRRHSGEEITMFVELVFRPIIKLLKELESAEKLELTDLYSWFMKKENIGKLDSIVLQSTLIAYHSMDFPKPMSDD
jgi:hypothetical protein